MPGQGVNAYLECRRRRVIEDGRAVTVAPETTPLWTLFLIKLSLSSDCLGLRSGFDPPDLDAQADARARLES
jgi:hypothetical protein